VNDSVILRFKRGRINIEGKPIYLVGLENTGNYPAYKYREIISHLKKSKILYVDKALKTTYPPKLNTVIKLREYQEKALIEWIEKEARGTIILPTGAGKTVIAIKAIEKMNVSTLIVAPTLILVDQWKKELEKNFQTSIGILGGGYEDIKPITVSTYDSASLRSRKLGNKFELLIFDEVHHLPAPSYQKIATRYLAPFRLGLTATLPKEESIKNLIKELIGETVYQLEIEDLSGTYLADFKVITSRIPLSHEEKQEYDRLFNIYRNFLRQNNIWIRNSRDYMRFVQRSGRDPKARKALLARNRAMDLAMNSSTKIKILKKLLEDNPEKKTLIFTRQNKLVYRLSKEMLIPAITHKTSREERETTLKRFQEGDYMRILSSRVLDEGVDVPDASMGIILSGSGSNRQFIQRLGRILRKKPNKEAILYELVSAGTAETYISARRKQK
jgi:superfamily II DNA or RNA helicase